MRQGNRRKKVISYSTPSSVYHNPQPPQKRLFFLTLHVLLDRRHTAVAGDCLSLAEATAPEGTPALLVCCFAQPRCGVWG